MAISGKNVIFYHQVGAEEAIIADDVRALIKTITGLTESEVALKMGVPARTNHTSEQYPVHQAVNVEFDSNEVAERKRFYVLHIAKSSIINVDFERFVLGSILVNAQKALGIPFSNGLELAQNFERIWKEQIKAMKPSGRVTEQTLADIGRLYFHVYGSIASFITRGTASIDKYKHEDGSGTFIIATTPLKTNS